jgi:hypothetical protein
MRGNWGTMLVSVAVIVLAAAAVWYFFSASSTDTQDLPYEHARGNPLAWRELEARPYDVSLSRPFRGMAVDADPKVRMAAIVYLAKGTEPEEVAVLIGALGDESPDVRAAAARACARRRLKRAVGSLIDLLDDPAIEVKGAAQSALMEITNKKRYMGRAEWEEWWRLHKEGFD